MCDEIVRPAKATRHNSIIMPLPGFSGAFDRRYQMTKDADFLLASVAKWIVANDLNGAEQSPEQRELVEKIKARLENLKGMRARGFTD
jgi:hypothetical protein